MSRRRVQGRLRPLTLADRRLKAARNDRRGRDRAYVPQARRRGPAEAPYLPPMEEAVARAREKHTGRRSSRLSRIFQGLADRIASVFRRRKGQDR